SPSTTVASTSRCTSPSRWSATSSVSSARPAPSGSTPARSAAPRVVADERAKRSSRQHGPLPASPHRKDRIMTGPKLNDGVLLLDDDRPLTKATAKYL